MAKHATPLLDQLESGPWPNKQHACAARIVSVL